jgi:hypothetical protein
VRIEDDEPLAPARYLLEGAGEAQRALRLRVETWAKGKGFEIADSHVVREEDGVTVRVPLFDVTDATAVVRATSLLATDLVLVVEPRRWSHRLRDRFGETFTFGDAAFDEAWHVTTSDERAARQVLEASRGALSAVRAWTRVTYDAGRIELHLDSDTLAGADILAAMDLVATIARAQIRTAAYR